MIKFAQDIIVSTISGKNNPRASWWQAGVHGNCLFRMIKGREIRTNAAPKRKDKK